MGYSLCIVAIFSNFQNALIFPILAVFSSRFLHRKTLICLQKRFLHIIGKCILSPKLSILHGLQPLHCGHFQQFSKCSHFSNISCFFPAVFLQNNLNELLETILASFRQFYFLTQSDYFYGLQPFHCGHFWHVSKCSFFLVLAVFSKLFLRGTT